MNQNKYLFLTLQQFIYLAYFIINTIIFVLAMRVGNEGITLRIFGGSDDGFFYWAQAKNVAAGLQWIRTSIYPMIIGTLMKVTGIESVYLIRMFNYLGFILLVLLSMRLIKIQFIQEQNKMDSKYIYNSGSMLLIGFLCYVSLQMQVNLSIYRDIWIYTIYVLSTYLSIKLIFYKKNRLLYFIILAFSVWLLGEFRGYAMISFLLAVGLYFVYTKVKLFKKPSMFIFIIILTFFVYYSFFMDFSILGMSLRKALDYRSSFLDIYSGGSQMRISLDQSNFALFLINYLHSYIGNLIGPLPWHISGISTLFVFTVETIPMIIMLRFLWKKRNLLTKVQKYILVHGFVWISLIGITNDNIGTATRLRPVTWILILLVFVVTYSKNKYCKEMLIKQVVA